MAAALGVYLVLNPIDSIEFAISFPENIVFFVVFILLVILHEVIHGLTWGIFAKGHRKAIAFGVIWKMLTPYCTCMEPLAKWQYIVGGAMPTLILGFVPAAVAAVMGNWGMLLLSAVMIISGGGDFFIIFKMLLNRHSNHDVLYYDHPYECGVVAFERR